MTTATRGAPEARASEGRSEARPTAEGAPPARRDPAPVTHHGTAAAIEILSGVAAGVAGGAVAGPPGMVAGAVLGGMVGAAAVVAIDQTAAATRAHDEALDADIGVIGGDLGNVQPPAEDDDARSAEEQFFDGPLSGADGPTG